MLGTRFLTFCIGRERGREGGREGEREREGERLKDPQEKKKDIHVSEGG